MYILISLYIERAQERHRERKKQKTERQETKWEKGRGWRGIEIQMKERQGMEESKRKLE